MEQKKHDKKMYLVKREVIATSVADALRRKGKVYEVTLAAPEYQPENEKPMQGFKTKINTNG